MTAQRVDIKLGMEDIGIGVRKLREFFKSLAQSAVDIILKRIEDGKRVDGSPLLDGSVDMYSPGYEKRKGNPYKRDSKKTGKKSGDYRRNLYSAGDRYRLTGQMLDALGIVRYDEKGSLAGFAQTEHALKAQGNDTNRPTSFALSQEEIDRCMEIAKATLQPGK